MRHFALFTGCWQCCPESRESPRLSALFTGSWQHWPPALFTSSPLSACEDYILASVEMNIQSASSLTYTVVFIVLPLKVIPSHPVERGADRGIMSTALKFTFLHHRHVPKKITPIIVISAPVSTTPCAGIPPMIT